MNVVRLDNGRIILIHAPCETALQAIKSQSVDMVFADLPYGTTQNKWDVVIPFDILWKQFNRIAKPRIPFVFTAREPFTSVLVNSNINEYHHKWVWNKKQSGSFQTAKYMPLQIEEDIIVFGDRPNYYPQMRTGKMRKRGGALETNRAMGENGLTAGYENWSDQYYPTNILEIANPRIGKLHPHEKPLELMTYLVLTYSNINDTVVDPTMGSGSTGVSCANTFRRFIGIEKDEYWFNVAVTRITDKLSLKNEATKSVPANSC
jgi:site-specific DNA-methyltransferase (adenine-specific)